MRNNLKFFKCRQRKIYDCNSIFEIISNYTRSYTRMRIAFPTISFWWENAMRLLDLLRLSVYHCSINRTCKIITGFLFLANQ